MRKEIATNVVLAGLGRVGGFIIPIMIGRIFGSNLSTDAFFFTQTMGLFLMTSMGSTFETVSVPIVSKIHADKKDWFGFSKKILFQLCKAFSPLMFILGILFYPAVNHLTGFSEEGVILSWKLWLFLIPVIFLSPLADLLNGALNAVKRFKVSAISPAFRSIPVILILWIFHSSLGIYVLPLGYLLGEGLRFLIIDSYARKISNREESSEESFEEEIKSFFKLSRIQMGGLFMMGSIPIIDQAMASWLGSGELSLFAYAERFRNIFFLLLSQGMGTVIFSYWSGYYYEISPFAFWNKIKRSLGIVFGIVFFICMISILTKDFLISLAYGAETLNSFDRNTIANVFAILMAGVPFLILNILCIRLLIILNKNKLYVKLGLISVVLNILLNLFFMQFWGIKGIALATSVLEMLFFMFLFWRINVFFKRQTV